MTYWPQTQLKDQYGFVSELTPMDEVRVVTPVRLVGSTFVGTTLDTNFWVAEQLSGATVTQVSGSIAFATSGVANSWASLRSVRLARYVGSSSNRYRAQVQLGDTGTTNNTRKWGAFTTTDGAYFKIVNTTVSVCTLRFGVETAVASASWNGSTTVPTLTNVNTYEIYWTNAKVYFVIGGVLVHTVSASTATWTTTTTLPLRTENYNTAGSTTAVRMEVRVATITRLGNLETEPKYYHFTSANTYIMKYGPGKLHHVTLNNAAGTLITIYDNVSAAGDTIAIINTPAQANPVTLQYGIAFNSGLTVVSTGTWDATVVYE
jgi:hypothetical protein